MLILVGEGGRKRCSSHHEPESEGEGSDQSPNIHFMGTFAATQLPLIRCYLLKGGPTAQVSAVTLHLVFEAESLVFHCVTYSLVSFQGFLQLKES